MPPAPQRFRKRPVEIEAMQLRKDNVAEVCNWSGAHSPWWDRGGNLNFMLDTSSGQQKLRQTDWVIKGVDGEFYPCPASVFDATYEAVTTPF